MIYLLRHGETVWNVGRRLQGQRDSPLTLRGIAQARALAALLGELIDDPAACRLVASPLGRTWQTAVILCETLGLDCRAIGFEPRLKEHHFGAWEGLTWPEVEAGFPKLWAEREADKWNFRAPEGESYAMVAARARQWLDERNGEEKLIVVGHGLAGRVLRGLYAGLSQDEIMAAYEPQDSLFRLADGVVQKFESGD
jgi:probable phosphoglycerate mutase